jgi:aconitate hydratase
MDLADVEPSVAGPKRPQDRIALSQLKEQFLALLTSPDGYGKLDAAQRATVRLADGKAPRPGGGEQLGETLPDGRSHNTSTLTEAEMMNNRPTPNRLGESSTQARPPSTVELTHGDVVIAAITSCTNTSNPAVMLAAGLLAKKAVELGLTVKPWVKHFETRIHQSVKANFLMSPPLVVAFAIAGRVDIDLTRDPLASIDGRDAYLRDIWPSMQEVDALLERAFDPSEYRRVYADFAERNPLWNRIPAATGHLYEWDPESLYIREPPYFTPSMTTAPSVEFSGARALAIFDDSITTDHISPAGAIQATSSAGDYLRDRGVADGDFNTYGARRGNHEVMVRGTFANVRIRNLMVPGLEGGLTHHQPDGERIGIYDAAERYRVEGVPLVVIAGQDYGAGSSRDWAAKSTRLLGVRAVIARGFERIHRSNLVGMGVLPCQLPEGVSAQTLGLDGTERFDLVVGELTRPGQPATLHMQGVDGRRESVPLLLRIDTPIEAACFLAGGIMPYVLEQLLTQASSIHRSLNH